jgi:hypothetical protein
MKMGFCARTRLEDRIQVLAERAIWTAARANRGSSRSQSVVRPAMSR